MSWKRYFKAVGAPLSPPMPSTSNDRGGAGTSSKFSSYLPEVYAGHPNRIQRYYQYDDMDRDSDINAALDTIADFCTQSEEQNKEPFEIYYTGEPNETEVKILKTALSKWMKLNDFRSRLWHMFRNTIKNGDAFFLRDPETAEWLWIDTFMVEMVKVDESAGKEPDEYIIRGLDYNKQAKFATLAVDPSQYRSPLGASNAAGARPQVIPSQAPGAFSLAGQAIDPRARDYMSGIMNQLVVVDAQHVVHLSLSVGMDINWPFGASILEPVFKTYKQKELLEDSVIIYRVQRAPERRIFYIDTGTMPPVRAKAHIEQVKNEIHQRRIPNRSGGGASILDAAYSPLGMLEDYFFASSCLSLDTFVPLLDGRTLKLSEIIEEYQQGKTNYVYSQNMQTNEFEPGKIAWAGVTRKDAEIFRITLDNNEYVDLTPDHRVIMRDGREVEVQNLQPGDSLMPLVENRKVVSIEKLPYREDTGDITVESASNSHVFALAAGIYVHNSDGRGSKVETLPGGEMTGEIGDLLFFSKKLARGLRIPTSYLPLGGEEEGTATFNDGKLGAALIQEFRFNKYCMRIQALLAPKFDKDFKWYLRKSGIEIDEELFELQFLPPQNFTKYRQIEVDAQQVQVYSQLAENKKLSERFKLKRFLNLTDDELLENEKLWAEENASKLKKTSGTTPAETPSQDLSSVGLRSGGGDFFGGEPEMPEGGEEGGGDMGGEAPAGGAGAAPAPAGGVPGGAPPAGGGGGGAPPAG